MAAVELIGLSMPLIHVEVHASARDEPAQLDQEAGNDEIVEIRQTSSNASERSPVANGDR